jgi:hypothetical protein
MADPIPPAQTTYPDERTVNYVFPVEVIVVAALTEDDHRMIEARIWDNFGEALGQSA